MTQGKPTPTPWATDSKWDQVLDGVAIRSGGNLIAKAMYLGGTDQAKANAALIVRAVNAHEAMKEALKRLLFDAFEDAHPEAVKMARAALKLAETE